MNVVISAWLGFIVFAVLYLMGAFYSVSFDISQWSDGTRFLVAFIGGVSIFGVSALVWHYLETRSE